MAVPIRKQFGMLSQVAPGNHVFDGVHIGVVLRIRLYHPCSAAMRP